MSDESYDTLLADFLDESQQLLDRLNESLLQLDERGRGEEPWQHGGEELLNEMFRSAHSLKGLSAMLSLGDINRLTHGMENVFDAARRDQLRIDGDVVDLMFQAVDRLLGLIEALKEPDAEPVECESVMERIRGMLHSAGVDCSQTSQEDAERALRQAATEALAASPGQEDGPGVGGGSGIPPGGLEASSESPPHGGPPHLGPSLTSPKEEPPGEPAEDCFRDLQDEPEAPAKYLSIFVDETEMCLDSLTETLLAWEEERGPETIEKLLITTHRIKGSAAAVGRNRPAKLAHLMEDLLQRLAAAGETLSPKIVDAMLMCADGLRSCIERLKRGESGPDQFADLARRLLQAQAAEAPRPTGGQAAADGSREKPEATAVPQECGASAGLPARLRERVAAASPDPDATLVGRVRFEPNLLLVGLKARLIHEKLCNLGEVCWFDPPAEKLDELEQLDEVCFGVSCEHPAKTVGGELRIGGVREVTIEPLGPSPGRDPAGGDAAEAASPEAPSSGSGMPATVEESGPAAPPDGRQKAGPADGGGKPAETLRVDIERLDRLMSLAGQLVINKARLAQIGEGLKSTLVGQQSSRVLEGVFGVLAGMALGQQGADSEKSLRAEVEYLRSQARRVQHELEGVRHDMEAVARARSSVHDLLEATHHLDRVCGGIQQSVMQTRMVPIGPLFARFKRVIRDVTRNNGKEIRLVIRGKQTELDKRMIDELGDPLIHMVRNAADHGIELPEVRQAAGKTRWGTVTLDAFHRGNSIIIRVGDNGKGLDPDTICRKAIEKGLLSRADAERMTRQQVFQLIWEPGLSTAEKVTEVSGRGMGMDIVKSKIEELHGTVDLESEPGQGTTLIVKLPLTLAILPSLMAEIMGDMYALPLESVVEIVRVSRGQLATVHGKCTARVRGRTVSTVGLEEIFHERGCRPEEPAEDEVDLVVLEEAGGEIALFVDRVLGKQDIVIKSLAENYREVPGIAGASILGDGRVSLILDPATLIEMCSGKTATAPISRELR